jgi:microcystin-dependent protein
MSFFKWSKTANNNATADSTINWAEGQAPSTVNDSARAMMAAAAKYRDDAAGAITSGGTATAYTVTSNQSFDSLANLDGKIIAFVPHVTNSTPVTLNVDGLGAKPLRSAPGVDLGVGVMVQGTPYVAVYNNSAAEWYLRGFFGPTDYSIPLGAGLPYFGAAAPNSKFVFPFGQAISRATYAGCFALLGTTYGAGDGATTFNLPDLRGRGLFGKDDMGGAAAGRITLGGSGIAGTALGAAGGAQTHTLAISETPSHTHANALSDPGHTHGVSGTTGGASANHAHSFSGATATDGVHFHQAALQNTTPSIGNVGSPGSGFNGPTGSVVNTSSDGGHAHGFSGATGIQDADHSHSFNVISAASTTGASVVNAPAGGGLAHNNMPPTMMVNYIMRVI